MPLEFEWDPRKDRSNNRKHGIGFAEAMSVFSNPLARIFPDEEHSAEERREIVIGQSAARRGRSGTIMKSRSRAKPNPKQPDELRAGYHFDYTKAKPNRFAGRVRPESVAILLDPDVAQVFKSAESVNAVLRALVATMPRRRTDERAI